MPTSLPAILDAAFTLLAEGAADPRSAWHVLSLASVGPDGGPHIRSVVLRGWDPARRMLEIHTDTRSAKYAQLRARPDAALHGWEPGARVQLRAGGRVSLHVADELARASWQDVHAASRATYAVCPGPGAVLDAPESVSRSSEDAAFAVFCVIRLQCERLEWLHLEQGSHRRARFCWEKDIHTAMWLSP